MPGLLYPAYHKFYSALSHLERFDKESNFFDNISALDAFFNEYRNITFVMQKSLRHTDYIKIYEKNRDKYLIDHWFIEKRDETIKEQPFPLVKEISITIYTPSENITMSEKRYSIDNDEPFESIFPDIKKTLNEIGSNEVFFSATFFFHEANSDIDLLKKLIQGVSAMKAFMYAMEKDIGDECLLCDQIKAKINDLHFSDTPLDFLCVNDYTYYPEKDCYEKAERISMLSENNRMVAYHRPLSEITQAKNFNFDGTTFGNFTLMHAIIKTINSDAPIMPVIMVVYGDGTYSLDAFESTMKTTVYRKVAEVSQKIAYEDVVEVCYMSLYSYFPGTADLTHPYMERIQQSEADMLVCASIDCQLNEKEYVFEGNKMEDLKCVICIMKNKCSKSLYISKYDLFPIWQAFKNKLLNNKSERHKTEK